jgi:hypothetical protein
MGRDRRTVEKQLEQYIKDRILRPRKKRSWVDITFEYEDEKITVWSVETVMGSSWAIGETGAQHELPWLYWKNDLETLDEATERGWQEYGYPAGHPKTVEGPRVFKPIPGLPLTDPPPPARKKS